MFIGSSLAATHKTSPPLPKAVKERLAEEKFSYVDKTELGSAWRGDAALNVKKLQEKLATKAKTYRGTHSLLQKAAVGFATVGAATGLAAAFGGFAVVAGAAVGVGVGAAAALSVMGFSADAKADRIDKEATRVAPLVDELGALGEQAADEVAEETPDTPQSPFKAWVARPKVVYDNFCLEMSQFSRPLTDKVAEGQQKLADSVKTLKAEMDFLRGPFDASQYSETVCEPCYAEPLRNLKNEVDFLKKPFESDQYTENCQPCYAEGLQAVKTEYEFLKKPFEKDQYTVVAAEPYCPDVIESVEHEIDFLAAPFAQSQYEVVEPQESKTE